MAAVVSFLVATRESGGAGEVVESPVKMLRRKQKLAGPPWAF